MLEKFWVRLRAYANKKVRQHHISKTKYDLKCNKCNTWTSEVGGWANLSGISTDNKLFKYMKCNRCGHISKWDCTGIGPTLIHENHKKNESKIKLLDCLFLCPL